MSNTKKHKSISLPEKQAKTAWEITTEILSIKPVITNNPIYDAKWVLLENAQKEIENAETYRELAENLFRICDKKRLELDAKIVKVNKLVETCTKNMCGD
jgi:hypothetical protein